MALVQIKQRWWNLRTGETFTVMDIHHNKQLVEVKDDFGRVSLMKQLDLVDNCSLMEEGK